MKVAIVAVMTLATMAALGAARASAHSSLEIKMARVDAAFGLPLSREQVKLLRRYGCYTDTISPVCEERRSVQRRRNDKRWPTR